MRQLSPSSNLVLAVLAGLGLLGSLTTPWFAAPTEDPNITDGPIERGAYQVGHVFATSARGMVEGGDALGGARVVLLVMVVVVGTLGLAISLNVLRGSAEDLLRMVAFAIPVVVLALAITHPGTTTDVRMHYGLLIAFAAALLMASASFHGAAWRKKYAAPARPRYTR